jgi:hypothetical protein
MVPCPDMNGDQRLKVDHSKFRWRNSNKLEKIQSFCWWIEIVMACSLFISNHYNERVKNIDDFDKIYLLSSHLDLNSYLGK